MASGFSYFNRFQNEYRNFYGRVATKADTLQNVIYFRLTILVPYPLFMEHPSSIKTKPSIKGGRYFKIQLLGASFLEQLTTINREKSLHLGLRTKINLSQDFKVESSFFYIRIFGCFLFLFQKYCCDQIRQKTFLIKLDCFKDDSSKKTKSIKTSIIHIDLCGFRRLLQQRKRI